VAASLFPFFIPLTKVYALIVSLSLSLSFRIRQFVSPALLPRGIAANAFESEYDSVHELIHRPILENVDYVPLRWKKDFLDRPIIKLNDHTFYNLWHQACLVAGFRVDPRTYALRVGAEDRLDGKRTQTLLFPPLFPLFSFLPFPSRRPRRRKGVMQRC